MTFALSTEMLQFLVLGIITQEDSYGYLISQRIRPVSNAKDSTLYPILKRLQEEGLVVAYDLQIQGRNRRYYSATPLGKSRYEQLREDWRLWKNEMDAILEGGENT